MGVEGDTGQASVAGLAQTADTFAPAEDAFDAAPDVLASSISFGAKRAGIGSGNLTVAQRGDMGPDLMLPAPVDHAATVVTAIRRQRMGPVPLSALAFQ